MLDGSANATWGIDPVPLPPLGFYAVLIDGVGLAWPAASLVCDSWPAGPIDGRRAYDGFPSPTSSTP